MNITSIDINRFLLFFIIGILLALIIQFISQSIYGRFLKKLHDEGAESDNKAKSLEDIEYSKNRIVKYALSHRTTLFFIIEKVIGEDNITRYYIPEKNSKKAQALYRGNNFSLATFLVLVASLIAVFFLCKYVIPLIF